MLGQRALEATLGIEEPVSVEPREMAEDLRMTRFPDEKGDPTEQEQAFADELATTFADLGVQMVDFESTLEPPPIGRALGWLTDGARRIVEDPTRLLGNGSDSHEETTTPGLAAITDIRWGAKVQPGTSVLAAGEGETGDLPVDYMGDFRDVTILTVVERPGDVEEGMPFTDHYERALELFAHHMTNVVVGVGDEQWFIYNFNGSHPFYAIDGDREHQILHSLVPKLAAPIRPPTLSEFTIAEQAFDPTDDTHQPLVEDLVGSGPLLEETGLYPEGMDLDDLEWRNDFYRWAGKIHLDDRTGMSYGFLARQTPTATVPGREPGAFAEATGTRPADPGEAFWVDGNLHVTLDLPEGPLVVPVPEVEVLTLASGCDKTDPHPREDLVKVGLRDGQMRMATPEGVELAEGYRPSFDTRVILAHAVGNALVASVLEHREGTHVFADDLAEEGMALVHWHGYLNPDHVPEGWHVHGADRPHVSCGTPQSAIYALDGKLAAFREAREDGLDFQGDVHIEPQHGTNLTHRTLADVGELLNTDDVAGLGNEHLDAYEPPAEPEAAPTP
ncbi:hypothetical protein BRD56_02970 [Thermoplasmatales archaeon SW_10_69_26]|nr:MAG: hypothetical protein BRD56_02970 [Thermoplasmatales archaeon SW_10_69_26]